MQTIFDRCRIDTSKIPDLKNLWAHSSDVASIAVRVAAATYALTSDPISAETKDGESEIPFKSLKEHLASGKGRTVSDWYDSGEDTNSFVVSVSGGAAHGVLLKNIIFIGFRGTENPEDWSINLFSPLKCPVQTMVYARTLFSCVSLKNANANVHGGFYRVSQALCLPLNYEIKELQKTYKDKNPNEKGDVPVILTGHSLGGALALLSGLEIEHHAVYTFGMPRVCERGLLPYLPRCHYRYELEGDIVPKFPPKLLGFIHDMPSLKLDPYLNKTHTKPNLVTKAISGFKKGVGLSSSVKEAVKAILATEHDMELYMKTLIPDVPQDETNHPHT